jgi:hypothetical protein
MAERAMTLAESNLVQAALAYSDICAVRDAGRHVSPAIREFSEQRLRNAAERVAEERGLESDDGR